MSSLTADSSPVTARARSASSQRSGREASASSWGRRARSSSTFRYPSASPSRARSDLSSSVRSRMGVGYLPWQSLYFLPEPHGHGALRGVLSHSDFTTGVLATGARVVVPAPTVPLPLPLPLAVAPTA